MPGYPLTCRPLLRRERTSSIRNAAGRLVMSLTIGSKQSVRCLEVPIDDLRLTIDDLTN